MENFIPLIILFGVWVLGLILFYRGYKSPLGIKYSDDELLLPQPKQEVEKFSRWYAFFYIFGKLFLLAFFISSIFVIPIVIGFLQKIFYARDASVFISPNTKFASTVPSVFFGILVGGLILKLVYQLFPKFNQYQALKDRINRNTMGLPKEEKKKIWEDALLKVDTAKLARSEWREFFIMGLIIWLLTVPFYIFAMDNYYKITSDGLIINPFLSLIEKRYTWSDIQSAKIYATTSKGDLGKINLNPKFEVFTNDGKTTDFWGGVGFGSPSSDELISVLGGLRSVGVKIDFQPLTEEQRNALLGYNQIAQSNVNAVFRYLESLK